MNNRKITASGKLAVLRLALHGKDTNIPVYNDRKEKKNTFLEKKKTVYNAMLKRKNQETSISLN